MSEVHKILSFDVGIKNLAYCKLEINKTTGRFKILDWNKINLADNRILCSHIKNNSQKCKSVATRSIKIDKNNIYYYCTSHLSKAQLDFKDIEIASLDISENNEKCIMCEKMGIYTSNLLKHPLCKTHYRSECIRNKLICATKKCKHIITKGLHIFDDNGNETLIIGWCIDHYEDEHKNYICKKKRKISQNCNKIPLTLLGTSMFQKLDNDPSFLHVDKVFIENQPTFINPTMKTISAMLYSYFVMRGIHEKDKNNSNISNISFCSPSKKIKVGGKKTDDKLKCTDDGVYKLTKDLAVKFSKALVSDNQEYLDMIDVHDKQDDLADALLQGFMAEFPIIPEYYAEKIRNVDINVEEIHKKNKIRTSKQSIKKNISIEIGKTSL